MAHKVDSPHIDQTPPFPPTSFEKVSKLLRQYHSALGFATSLLEYLDAMERQRKQLREQYWQILQEIFALSPFKEHWEKMQEQFFIPPKTKEDETMIQGLFAPYYNAVQEFQSALLRFWLLPQDIAKFSLRLEDTEEILRGAPPESAEEASQKIEVSCSKDPALMKAFFTSIFFSESGKDTLYQRFGCPQSTESIQEYITRSEKWNGQRFFLKKDDVIIGCCEAYPTHKEGEVEISYIIHPDYQKQGYGRKLLIFAMKYLKEQGISSLSAQPTHAGSEAFLRKAIPENTVPPIGTGSYGEDTRKLTLALL